MSSSLRSWLSAPDIQVGLVAAVCLLAEAVIAKNVLHVRLDFVSQFASMWVFIAYLWSGGRRRTTAWAAMAVAVATTVAVLVLYAV